MIRPVSCTGERVPTAASVPVSSCLTAAAVVPAKHQFFSPVRWNVGGKSPGPPLLLALAVQSSERVCMCGSTCGLD